jgi:Flp pilus assembly pilin Flp
MAARLPAAEDMGGGQMLRLWIRFHTDDGASLVEYAFLLLLIAVVAIAVISQVGGSASEAFSRADDGFK